MKSPVVPFASLEPAALGERLKQEGLRLTVDEARRVAELIGHEPTRVEAVLFDTLWSEHCSYKSSRAVLKEFLPTEAPHVILGPGEDAGVVYLTTHNGERWALVVGHESHNHPSQVVPFEGAATGIGGIVRDIYCMGADVVGVLDALRFGSLTGEHAEQSREIARGVVDGIWHYGNALGVPNLGGDVVFDARYDDNCLVNVVALGVVPEHRLVRSRVPVEAREVPYVFVLVGKPTDSSGFGGASFASADLDESEAESNKGAVQVPDPFLKRVLAEANRAVLDLAHAEGVATGFKDLGAGGIACATSELAAAGEFGADIELTQVATAGALPPEVVACSETQERFCWVVPEDFAPHVLRIYNEDYELPHLYPGARAQVIGRVRTEDTRYHVNHSGDRVCDVSVEAITHGVRYDRAAAPDAPPPTGDPVIRADSGEALAGLLRSTHLASRERIYRHYDCEVQGRAVLRPGEADASVFLPVEGCPLGVAVSVDGNPFYGLLDPYQGGANAVAESMRNVAAVGATPWCLTDCLNYGNPEDPRVFRQFREGVRGIGDAAREIGLIGETGVAVPIVSGNVSLYNQSARGRAIPPSPIVACFGIMPDYSVCITPAFKRDGNRVLLLGPRRKELGGSALYRWAGVEGGTPPRVDFARTRAEIATVVEGIRAGHIAAAHDISEGGLAVALAEMAFAGELGCSLDLGMEPDGLSPQEFLFSETGGFILEAPDGELDALRALAARHGAGLRELGAVTRSEDLVVATLGVEVLNLDTRKLAQAWRTGLEEVWR